MMQAPSPWWCCPHNHPSWPRPRDSLRTITVGPIRTAVRPGRLPIRIAARRVKDLPADTHAVRANTLQAYLICDLDGCAECAGLVAQIPASGADEGELQELQLRLHPARVAAVVSLVYDAPEAMTPT